MKDEINFVDTIKIELKRKTPEELSEKICELVTDNIIKDKEIKKLKNQINLLQENLIDSDKEWTYWEDRCDKAEERLNKLIDNLELKGE